ncbi:sensor histidine kinase, partial [Bacteroides xylanisolvens]
MKIGSKIALFYTLISVLTTVIIIAVFYIFSTQYINKLYASYLREKAYLTAQKHWEKDEVDEQSYQIIQRKYDELLPEAHEILLNMDSLSEVRDTLNKYLTQHQQTLLLARQDSIPFSFKYKDQLGAALYYPDNEGNFIVLVMSRNAYGTEIKEHLLLLSIFLVLASSILIFFIGKIYSGRILVPLQHILKELKRIRANSLNRRLKTTGNNDELEDMIKTLNSMLDRLDSAFKAEKSFVSHASHELNNPITAIQGECEISLLKERSTGEYIESLQRISSESKRLSSLIRHLLFLSRQEEELLKNNVEEIILSDILKELTGSNERIRLHLEATEQQAVVKANPYLLKIALKNIIDNAC